MNEATTILRQEHEAILRMLEVTTEVSRQLLAGQKVAPEILSGLLEFSKLFADRCHHGKEEDLLFPLLERKGMPRQGGPIGVMLGEHDEGRALIGTMTNAVAPFTSGDAEAGRRWAGAAEQYAQLLREHIFKENNILFMMAERMLSDAEQKQLAAEFEKSEAEKMGEGTHQRLHALMEKIEDAVLHPKS
ncbi:MAG: hemerythrin domain-containing protein [Acidobacteria bacterium]|nr:hemerythrin domain-containing protein [Acidobacteriota bacterium]MCL5288843.1 hemerythrin domain-containing protein [Acidobacteriota bacterium]